jgi:hypothetical protein
VDNLFIIAIVAYWVLQAIASKKKRDRESLEAADSAEPLSELDQALSEIREVLGGPPAPDPEPSQSAEASPPAAPPSSLPSAPGHIPDRRATAPTRISTAAKSATRGPSMLEPSPDAVPIPIRKPSDDFHQVTAGETDWHNDSESFGSEWKSSGASASEWGADKAKPAPTGRVTENTFEASGPEFRDALIGHDHLGIPKSTQGPSTLAGRFSSPKAFKDAIIAREVLGPPKSKRGPGR